MPLIAILRGLRPSEAVAVADALVTAGFKLIEVPLNSPEPFKSIEILAKHLAGDCVVGVGTVLRVEDVSSVTSAGGQFIVAPNLNRKVGDAAKKNGLTWCPGVLTPSEAFEAVDQGADLLKIFPAELVSPAGVRALRAVLPPRVLIAAVGGITPQSMEDYVAAGSNGFGLGSSLYKAGMSPGEVKERAIRFTSEFDKLRKPDSIRP
ncbi:MAG: 2-dehydro-3-deoxy-6-phosphogalactonate aldolase [Acidiferrobacteraceae bacterium]|jgi:2-dehydro-3-deoxyphosphogalactonate aldolase|nr:2-dehydro-3-deoxy-6-phosphogalactonate aldolase [Acidiferrobacteraceae bacterium]MBT4808089.1 2-dehydro-3-deoxy-6-phosphogalactonate aldolase [Acidiferrobacteraceae bacterium]